MIDLVHALADLLLAKRMRLAIAESCTGGLLASWLTRLPGSSNWFECGWVVYSNQAKQALLDVPSDILETYGAVSEQTVVCLAESALQKAQVDLAVAVSGIAGPSGGSADKPVGTVWFAWAYRGEATRSEKRLFSGSRESIQEQAATVALEGLILRVSAKE